MARYVGRAPDLSLAPHMYIHDLQCGRYVVVQPKKGHTTIFAIREGYSTPHALAQCRARGFRPLYVVRASAKR